jgi:ATP-binding cassette subfamily B protein
LGERQRIALARALLGNPSILLLDEVDANLDPRTRKILDRVLRSYRGTVLMVTHQKERVEQADMIWHVAEGRLVETGPPAKLFANRGPTSRLFESDRIPALCG